MPIPGWTTSTNFTEHTYDPAGSANFPDVAASAAINGGKQFFAGGPENGAGNGVETATQVLSIASAASQIDSGGVAATLSADLGGFADQEDQASAAASFLGSAGQQLGRVAIAPVTAADRHDTTELLARTGSAAVPAGTRSVRVVMTATKFAGAYNDAYLDNLSLTLLPPPAIGKTVDVGTVTGKVFVRLPGSASAALAKGRGFVPLTQGRQLPVGSQVDARAGSLQLITASAHIGKTQSGTFGGGLFGLAQDHKGLTTLSLLEGDFRGAPTYAACRARAATDPAARVAVSRRVLQTLRSNVHGRFRTRGR